MSRIVNRTVQVYTARAGRPAAYRWAGHWHRVAEILDAWVYREPWWEQRFLPERGPDNAPERTFYRIIDQAGAVVELMHRDPEGDWRLYRMYD